MEKKELLLVNINETQKGLYCRFDDIPEVWQNSYTTIYVYEEAYNKGLVNICTYEDFLVKNKTSFSREEVIYLLVNMYMNTAEIYNDYDRTADFYTEAAHKFVNKTMISI